MNDQIGKKLPGFVDPSCFLQALAEDKTRASLLKSVSWGTKPSQLFAYALLLNDMSARFFQMFGKRR